VRTGHLFAGIDGIGLGLKAHGFESRWFSEIDASASKVLSCHYPNVPNHGDVKKIDWSQVEPVDVLTGGFPCQDVSYAGKGAGLNESTRSGLWYEYARAIRELQPRLVIVENVPALLGRGFGVVLGDLAACGFDAVWTCLRASDVGAPHKRERLFLVAYLPEQGPQGRREGLEFSIPRRPNETRVGYVTPRCSTEPFRRLWGKYSTAIDEWEAIIGRPPPSALLGGIVNPEYIEWHMGFPSGWTEMLPTKHRARTLGNAVVPQCSEVVGLWAMKMLGEG